jgi:hypothetical protein
MGRSTTEPPHGAQILRYASALCASELWLWADSVKDNELERYTKGLLPTYYYIPWDIPWESAQPSGSASEA